MAGARLILGGFSLTSVSSLPLLIRDVVPDDADALAHILITAEEHTFRGLVPDACLQSTEAESAANWKRFLTRGLDA